MEDRFLIAALVVLSVVFVSGCTAIDGDCVSQGNVATSLSQKCCEGLTKVPNCFLKGDGNCDCGPNNERGEMLCLRCGDGTCQPDESKCSCPADCKDNVFVCSEGERQNYTCPNNITEIEWCICKSNEWFCPINPAEACIGHGNCINDSDCNTGEICIEDICEDICKENHTSDCFSGNLFWFDSCGKLGEMKEKCGSGCINGVCIGCKAEDHLNCSDNDVYWFDSCGVRERIYEDCMGSCNLGECCTPNVTFRCYQGDIHWVDDCNYTQDDLKENCTAGHGCYVENDTCVTCDDHIYFTCVNGDTGDIYWFNSCGDRQEIHTDCDHGCLGTECLPDCTDPDNALGEPDMYLTATTVTDRHGNNWTDTCEEDSTHVKEYICSATHDADYKVEYCGAFYNCTAGECMPS